MGRRSLSARRAWIEIATTLPSITRYFVALRKESVDRNLLCRLVAGSLIVALRKESVDRNLLMWYQCNTVVSRSPQGERG